MFEAEFDFARSEDKDATSAAKIERLREAYLAKAIGNGAKEPAVTAIESYFKEIAASIRWVEKTRAAAEASHLTALVDFAQRAYRRTLRPAERDELLGFYRSLRKDQELGHEDAIRDAMASVLMSPHFCYRFELAAAGRGVRRLDDFELASRLSYFLWSTMPDDELLAHAASGDLREPKVLAAQTRRMLRDDRVRGLASEFLGNLLEFRRFEEHNSVDRQRFPGFTNELRQAMYEEPLRFFTDLAQNNRSVLELLEGKHTFVNRPLARHYGMPFPPGRPEGWLHALRESSKAPPQDSAAGSSPTGSIDQWARVENATPYGRGGMGAVACCRWPCS
jgi:hypothetical protein